jgi:hypothetical protein
MIIMENSRMSHTNIDVGVLDEFFITAITIETPFNNDSLSDEQSESLCNELLGLEGVVEIQQYSYIFVTCEPEGKSDSDVIQNLNSIRKEIFRVLSNYFK